LTVGCVAMPLSLAIALASGVSPEVGLVSAIVGGSIACLLGGTFFSFFSFFYLFFHTHFYIQFYFFCIFYVLF